MDQILILSDLELRESGRLHGLLLTEGRASSDRKELFLAGSVSWPSTGIRIRPRHLVDEGSVLAYPYRDGADGAEIRVNVQPSTELREAVQSGAKSMSVEFRAVEESVTPSGIREIISALLVGAAVVRNPSYKQTAAEIRAGKDLLSTDYLNTL